MVVMKSLTELAFSCRLWRSLLLVKFQVLTINMKPLLQMAVTESVIRLFLSKVLDLY